MYSNRENRKFFGYAVSTALAASLVVSCAGSDPMAKVNSASSVAAKKASYSNDKGIASAEKAVAKDPQNASLRVQLANAYLGAGRFESAATTFEDAIALGDKSPGTALGLSLAYVGTGRNADAQTLLDQWRDSIPASDYGLAIALAGETSNGVAILSDQLRSDHADAKLRQNLAYAYALDGRWSDARLMAAQDLPADQLDARISQWAMEGRPEDYRKRVAGLLGAPVRSDSGQPEFLALSKPSAETSPAMASAADATPVPAGQPDREPPPVAENSQTFLRAENDQPTSLLMPVEKHDAAPPSPEPAASSDPQPAAPVGQNFDHAFAAADPTPRYVSRAVVQPVPDRQEPAAASVWTASQGEATHLVQLGSFSSMENAERARKIYQHRYSSLKDHELRITEAVVRGKKYWRVAAAGYDRSSANSMCSSVKGRGYGCIAYAEDRPLPGALPGTAGSGPMRARR